jgi:hypothetical protein
MNSKNNSNLNTTPIVNPISAYEPVETPIILKYAADTVIRIPIAGGNPNVTQAYNWNVSVDGISKGVFSGAGKEGIIRIGELEETEHTVTISPVTPGYGWARAFGCFDGAGLYVKITKVIQDPDEAFMVSATDTGDYFRRRQYNDCRLLTSILDETLPDGVTTIGANFRAAQYEDCPLLTRAAAEALPNSVTTIGDNFRESQYAETAVTAAAAEVLPGSVRHIGESFRAYQYTNCAELTQAADFTEPVNASVDRDGYRYQQYYNVPLSGSVAIYDRADDGNVEPGDMLSFNTHLLFRYGAVNPDGTKIWYAQWYRDADVIFSATGDTYLLKEADSGHEISIGLKSAVSGSIYNLNGTISSDKLPVEQPPLTGSDSVKVTLGALKIANVAPLPTGRFTFGVFKAEDAGEAGDAGDARTRRF